VVYSDALKELSSFTFNFVLGRDKNEQNRESAGVIQFLCSRMDSVDGAMHTLSYISGFNQ
jgi:hypothetical protein